MAKGVGLDAGAFEVKVVELDGSYRKPRLAKVNIDRVPAAGANLEGHEQEEAEAALHALKDAQIGRDGVCLGFPCREAVLRAMTVPFVGDDQIRKVLKFEAEGEIQHHNVDDMVVDFHVLERGQTDTRVLVAAVPKKSLGTLLDALAEFGIDPERVDLDLMALFRAAEWAGCFGEDVAEAAAAAAEEAGEEEDASSLPVTATGNALINGGGRRVRLIVDVGARSTRVLAVDGGKLIDMRALRVGFESLVDEIAAHCRIPQDEARVAVWQAIRTGTDVQLETPASATSAAGEELVDAANAMTDVETGPEISPRAEIVLWADVDAARERLFHRLKRELMRFLTALPQIASVERAFITGGGSAVPGVSELLAETFDCAVTPLDVLTRLSHNLPPEEAEAIGPRIAVAIGLALGTMGGPGGFDFRQEELAYRRRFDRIKFPLAIACMLCVFLPFIYGVRQSQPAQPARAAIRSALLGVGRERQERPRLGDHAGVVRRLRRLGREPLDGQQPADPPARPQDVRGDDQTAHRHGHVRTTAGDPELPREGAEEAAGGDRRLRGPAGPVRRLRALILRQHRAAEREGAGSVPRHRDRSQARRTPRQHDLQDRAARARLPATLCDVPGGAAHDVRRSEQSVRRVRQGGRRGRVPEQRRRGRDLRGAPRPQERLRRKGGVMGFFKNMDLNKAMILGSLLLLPVALGFVYWVQGRLEVAQRAVASAERSGGELEKIGKAEQQLETIRQNVQRGGLTENHRLYFEQRILSSVRDGGIKSTDFEISNQVPHRVSKASAIDQEVTIQFRRDGKELDLNRDFIYAVLFNCESGGSQVWKLRELRIANTPAAEASRSRGRQIPPKTVDDLWQVKKLVFVRREPDSSAHRR